MVKMLLDVVEAASPEANNCNQGRRLDRLSEANSVADIVPVQVRIVRGLEGYYGNGGQCCSQEAGQASDAVSGLPTYKRRLQAFERSPQQESSPSRECQAHPKASAPGPCH